MTGESDAQAAFCAVLCDEWARCGIADAVVAPGSRSTPMVAALDAEERIRVHVVLDERSAGFTALGLALGSGRPAVVVTTSGTASVELHPAVVEASQAGVPLIAVTTDRPPELHHVGAPQTVEQQGLFGPAARWAADPGVPDAATAAGWRSLACRAVAEAVGWRGRAGPVHLNLPFREPLLGRPGAADLPPGRPGGRPWHDPVPARPVPAGGGLSGVAGLLADHVGGRGLVIAGEGCGQPAAVLDLAGRLGWPVLADPRSGVRRPGPPVVAAADLLLRGAPAADWIPDVVLRIGGPWTSKVMGQWLAALGPEVPQVVLDPGARWIDPDRRASHVLTVGAGELAAALNSRRIGPAGWSAWAEKWMSAEEAAQAVLDEQLGAGGPLAWSEPAVARACLAAVPDGGMLVASSSMPVRDVEWFGRPRDRARVLSNRGANGIDGVISTAMGAALAGGQPTVLLIGDLAFLYDAGALLWAADRPVRLSIVVVDNDGGGIFSFLPQASELPADRFERYWGTPHGLDLAAVAAAYRLEASAVADRPALEAFLARAGEPGVRVAVVRSARQANVAVHEQLNRAVAGAVSGI